jgi:hypothetical protein
MKLLIPLLFLSLSFAPEILFADSWVLITPEVAMSEPERTAKTKWVVLESFTTALQCSDHRSSLIRQLANERRQLKDAKDHNAPEETERELRLLWHLYTESKCVTFSTLTKFYKR